MDGDRVVFDRARSGLLDRVVALLQDSPSGNLADLMRATSVAANADLVRRCTLRRMEATAAAPTGAQTGQAAPASGHTPRTRRLLTRPGFG